MLMAVLSHLRGATFDVRAYGAMGDGKTDDTTAVRKAAHALALAGGGTLRFAHGFSFVTGPFNLSSNAVVDVGGTILGSLDGGDWPLVDAGAVWPQFGHGSDCTPGTEQCRLMHQALIFAWNATNISMSGGGTIDARGQPWWACAARLDKPPCSGHARPHLLMLSNSTRVHVSDVSFRNSPDWSLHFSSVRDLHITRVHVQNPPRNAPNSDGIDLDCVQNALVEDSVFDVGDDALCVKSGIDWFGRRFGHPSRNLLFRNLSIGSGHGISIGSESSGDVFNVTFDGLRLSGTARGPRIKSQRGRGGLVDGIVYRNILAKEIGTAFSLSLNYHPGLPRTNATATPRLRNVLLENITFERSSSAGELDGLGESRIENVTLRNVVYVGGDKPPAFGTCMHVSGSCEGATNVCPPCFSKRA